MKKYSLITFLLIWVATHCANAQEKILQFVTGQEINVGTLSEDDEASAYRFVFHNSSKRSIKLTKVTTTCGCTAAQFTQKELNPGEKVRLYSPIIRTGHPGKLYTRAFVYIRPVFFNSGSRTCADRHSHSFQKAMEKFSL